MMFDPSEFVTGPYGTTMPGLNDIQREYGSNLKRSFEEMNYKEAPAQTISSTDITMEISLWSQEHNDLDSTVFNAPVMRDLVWKMNDAIWPEGAKPSSEETTFYDPYALAHFLKNQGKKIQDEITRNGAIEAEMIAFCNKVLSGEILFGGKMRSGGLYEKYPDEYHWMFGSDHLTSQIFRWAGAMYSSNLVSALSGFKDKKHRPDVNILETIILEMSGYETRSPLMTKTQEAIDSGSERPFIEKTVAIQSRHMMLYFECGFQEDKWKGPVSLKFECVEIPFKILSPTDYGYTMDLRPGHNIGSIGTLHGGYTIGQCDLVKYMDSKSEKTVDEWYEGEYSKLDCVFPLNIDVTF